MKQKRQTPRLLASELEIFEILWQHGPVTIIEVQRELSKPVGYTTVQTRLNRLVAKGYVDRGKTRPAKYSAAITQQEVTAVDLGLLVEKVNSGSAMPLLTHLVSESSLTSDEIEELRMLIDSLEHRSNSPGQKK